MARFIDLADWGVMAFLWIIATVLASGFQVARNGLQRSVMGQAGP